MAFSLPAKENNKNKVTVGQTKCKIESFLINIHTRITWKNVCSNLIQKYRESYKLEPKNTVE